jgi:pimeloyl-ACP methyl ester carboxylesterase
VAAQLGINYRWRLSLADGERKYAELENRIDAVPVIAVPTITMGGDANGAPHDPRPLTATSSRASTNTGSSPAGGHNLPQEAPQAFAKAIVDVAAE